MMEELEDMRDSRPNGKFDRDVRSAGAMREARAVVQKSFIGAHMNEQRRQPSKVGKKRRCQRQARIEIAEIEILEAQQGFVAKKSATPRVGLA